MEDKGRRGAVRVIALIMAVSAVSFGLFTAIFGIISEDQRIHAFHNVVVASLLLVLSAPAAIALAREPGRVIPLIILTGLSIAGLLTMAISLTLDPFTLPVIALVGVLWAVRPGREWVVRAGRPSPILLLLVIAGAVPLIVYALGQAELQREFPSSEHASFRHWAETSFYAVSVLLLGLLAAVGPAAYRLAAWCAGVALAILGGASLALGDYESALDAPWAWAALGGGLAFLAVAEWEARRAPAG